MPNFDGVWELRFAYTVPIAGQPTLPHQHTIDVAVNGFPEPGQSFETISVLDRNGDESTLAAFVELYITRLKPLYRTDVEFSAVELWQYPLTGTNGTWISVYAIGEAGSSASATNPAGQMTMTLRSQGGGIMRIQLMETVFTQNNQETFPFANSSVQNLATFLLGTGSVARARDDTYPVAPLRVSFGQNEATWRKRYRP